MFMITTEMKMLELAIFLTLVTAAVILPARSQELSVSISGVERGFSAPAGESLNVICQGFGNGKQSVSSLKWLDKDGNVILESIPGTQEGESNSLILTFSDPKIEDSGNYTCTAMYNEKSLDKTVPITFYTNRARPKFDMPHENVVAEEGSYLEIFCRVDRSAFMMYEWFNQSDDKITGSRNSSIYMWQTGYGSTLVIENVALSDEGLYTCSATNSDGRATKVYQLIVLPSSGNDTSNDDSRITSFRAISVTTTSVKFAFNFSGRVRFIKVRYWESQKRFTVYSNQWKYGDSYEVKNLIPEGLYEFQFLSMPSLNGTWSTSYRVVLLPDVPDVIFLNLGVGSATFEWFRPSDDRRNTVDMHELTYFTVREGIDKTWIASSCNITVQLPGCVGSKYTISGLSKRAYYQIQLRAHTASGYGEPSKHKIYLE